MRSLKAVLFLALLFLAVLCWFELCGPSAYAQSTPAGAGGVSLNTNTEGSFLRRLFKAYSDDWWPPAAANASAPAPAFRGDPAPVNGPPFPFSTWPIGGTVSIGQPWTQAGPWMTALWAGPDGDAWKKHKIQIYGWLNVGANFSTSKGGVNSSEGKYDNFPTAYDEVPNAIEPDQEVLYIERQPDTVQTEHFDWGFRLAGLWGLDYRFTTAKGYFSQQLLGHPPGDPAPENWTI